MFVDTEPLTSKVDSGVIVPTPTCADKLKHKNKKRGENIFFIFKCKLQISVIFTKKIKKQYYLNTNFY